MDNERRNIRIFSIPNEEALDKIENNYRDREVEDKIPYANGSSFKELATKMITDKNGAWNTPLLYIISRHRTELGMDSLTQKLHGFLNDVDNNGFIDILSITTKIEDNKIICKSLIRPYNVDFNYLKFFAQTGDPVDEEENVTEEVTTGNLIVPDEIKNFKYSEAEIEKHKEKYETQKQIFDNCTLEKPFLNSIDFYEPKNLPLPEEKLDLIYDLKTTDMSVKTITPYDQFTEIFREVMNMVNGVDYYQYITVIRGEKSEDEFMNYLRTYVTGTYVKTGRLKEEDFQIMIDKLYKSLFRLYIVQDLIDDPEVTDIKITGPDSIRARIDGKAYLSNISFIDANDYKRFVNMVCIRNKVFQSIPEQTFTDDKDENYILRFSLTAEYVNSVKWPYLHIRKIKREKLMAPDLIKKGMMDEKLRDYLLDCGKHSRGVVFAGPPGSGKTVCLNWFLEEAYEQSAEILVIQENDELFTNRKGVMFQHVVNYPNENEYPVSLEELGRLALVAGANVFIIGEAKGAEICSAITLSNSGCRTALTIHSPSSTETIDKMADLALRGFATNILQAKKSLKSFQTIVYLENFQIKEISEIIGFDDRTGDMKYRYIYRREEE